MTPKEEKAVLEWLYLRPKNPRYWLKERRILQRALRGGEDISREIRDALADWVQDNPGSLFHAYGASKPILQALGLLPEPAPASSADPTALD